MATRIWVSLTLAALMAVSVPAQDARSVLQAAARTMGVENMRSIQYTGTGWQGMVGQNFTPDLDWPRVDLTSYTRTIDFDTMSSREEYVRAQGNNPPRGGGAGFPFLMPQKVVNFVSGTYAWTLNAQGPCYEFGLFKQRADHSTQNVLSQCFEAARAPAQKGTLHRWRLIVATNSSGSGTLCTST